MQKLKASDSVSGSVARRPSSQEEAGMKGRYVIECRSAIGDLKWTENISNLIVNQGLNSNLDTMFGGVAKSSWYIGLTDSAPTVAPTDTLASAPGWAEVEDYSEITRPLCTFGASASETISNVGNEATFTANATVVVGGAFLASDNTKGGTTGILFSVGAFDGGDKSLDATDTLNVAYVCAIIDA